MDTILSAMGARAVETERLEKAVLAKTSKRKLAGIATRASPSAIAAELARANAQALALRQGSSKRAHGGTPTRLDGVNVKVALLSRMAAAASAEASRGQGFMGVLGQKDSVRLGHMTPFEAAAAGKQAVGEEAVASPLRVEVASRPPSSPQPPPPDLMSLYADTAAGVNTGRKVQRRPPRPVAPSVRGSDIPDDFDVAHYTRRATDSAQEVGDAMARLPGGLQVHASLLSSLLPYQITGLRWLCELHSQRVGGIIADEMGLGKTVQVVALLGALAVSKWRGVSLVICPATMLGHWYRELTTWCPHLRVLVAHDAAHSVRAGAVSKAGVVSAAFSATTPPINVVLMTYGRVRSDIHDLCQRPWGYVVLDEGHRIRNPDAGVTKAIKALNTVHRIVVTGAPIQNKLSELWSLFDFAFPGRLGSRETFQSQFASPIAAGSWATATPLQSQTAFQCATVLRDLIQPYLLRRVKKDVSAQLPPKTEQVIFTRITDTQATMYKAFLASPALGRVLDGSNRSFRALGMLQKLCNHPGLFAAKQLQDEGAPSSSSFLLQEEGGPSVGNMSSRQALGESQWEASGKMVAAVSIVQAWLDAGHRVLWFCQGREMLDVIEGYTRAVAGWSYMRMDGNTPVGHRQAMVDTYNHDTSVQVFLLTTRVGGLGVNLTGADRVLLFDPAWNPSTDAQARERAWRLGQTKPVVVYRLISAGTLEEKVYERQVFKQLLMARVLGRGGGRGTVAESHLRELFTLVDEAGLVTAPPNPNGFTPLTAQGRGEKGGRTVTVAGVAVRVEEYDSEDEALAPVSIPDQGGGEAGVLAALMGSGDLAANFKGGVGLLSPAQQQQITEAATEAAAAAAAAVGARLGGASLPAAPVATARRRARKRLVRQTPDPRPPNRRFGRVSILTCLKLWDAPHTAAVTVSSVSRPGKVRGGFLLGVPPGAVMEAATAHREAVPSNLHAPLQTAALPSSPQIGERCLSSASLLSRLAQRAAPRPAETALHTDSSGRTWGGVLGTSSTEAPAPPAPPSDALQAMTGRLVGILHRQAAITGWRAGMPSPAVVRAYGAHATADKAVFRAVLRSIARFSKQGKVWVLRPPLRGDCPE